jgi:hypothetical protein
MVLTTSDSFLGVCTLPAPQKQHGESAQMEKCINERMSNKVTLQDTLLIQQV